MKKVLAVGFVALLTGCGSTGTVMKLGPDTYIISASKHYTSGGTVAQQNALEAANTYCVGLGKEVLVKNMANGSEGNGTFYTHTVTFQCLNKNDPDLARPTYRPTPNIVIENRK
jgi:hypothetical protein